MANHWWQVTSLRDGARPHHLADSRRAIARPRHRARLPRSHALVDAHERRRLSLRCLCATVRSPASTRDYMERLGRLGIEVRLYPFAVEMTERIRLDQDARTLPLRSGLGESLLPRARAGRPPAEAVPRPVHRQGQPGPLLLGRPSISRSPASRGARPRPSRRHPQRRRLGDAGGLLARGEQRRVLAGRRAIPRGGVLRLRLSASRPGFSGAPVRPAAARYEPSLRRVRAPLPRACAAPLDPEAAVLELSREHATRRPPI